MNSMGNCVKTVLIILTQNDQRNLNVNESISALMLFASFNISISVLFKDAGLSLLRHLAPASKYDAQQQLKDFLKPCAKMIESFEFYDIEHLHVLSSDAHHPLVSQCSFDLQPIQLDQQFIQKFDHVLTW